jgi:hypothetical protein
MMTWLRKRVVPRVLQILLLFFVVAAATVDDLAAENVFQNEPHSLKQTLCNDNTGDSEHHIWKAHKCVSLTDDGFPLPHLAIRIYLDRVQGLLIPAQPAVFFQPDRAPPDSLL